MLSSVWSLALVGCSVESSVSLSTPRSEEPIPLIVPEDDEGACVEQPVTLYLSPDDSNSMSSAVQAREAAMAGDLLSVPIRPWEFLNYYTFDYPRASEGELGVFLDLAPGAVEGEYTMQIGVSSAPATPTHANVALVIDDSCSMEGAPLETAADIGRSIAGSLRAGDRVSIVTWSDEQRVVLEDHEVSGPSDPDVVRALGRLRSRGSTNLSAGLNEGYALLRRHFTEGRMHRLVLISDGGANVGQTDEQVIGEAAGAEEEDGIYLVGVGVGAPGFYDDLLMDTVTDLGKGASVYVPDRDEADRMFGARWASTMAVGARDVQVRLDLPAGLELVRTSAEEVSTDPEEVRPQHVAADDAVVLHQTLAACGTVGEEEPIGVTVTWLDPITFELREAGATATLGELLAQDHRLLRKGAAVVAYTDALVAVRDELGGEVALDIAESAVEAAQQDPPGDADLVEMAATLTALRANLRD